MYTILPQKFIKNKQKGFTLMELMISMVILGILAALISGNFISSLKRGRDARRKQDLKELQNALEIYYENNRSYPTSITFGGKFTDGGKTYMQKVPSDPQAPDCNYVYLKESGTSPSYYYLLATIENEQDNAYGVSQTGYLDPNTGTVIQCGNCVCKYYVSSPNAPQLTPAP